MFKNQCYNPEGHKFYVKGHELYFSRLSANKIFRVSYLILDVFDGSIFLLSISEIMYEYEPEYTSSGKLHL